MKRNLLSVLLVTLALCCYNQVQAQDCNTEQGRRELLENEFKGKSPLITYGLDTLSQEEFINLKATNPRVVILHGDTARWLYGKYAKRGAIQVWSDDIKDYNAADSLRNTKYADEKLSERLEVIALLKLYPIDAGPVLYIDDKVVSVKQFLSYRHGKDTVLLRANLGLYSPDSEEGKRGVMRISTGKKR